MLLIGKVLIMASIALIFLAYVNFIPTSLGTPKIADYIKNHFVREVVFGVSLACLTICLVLRAQSMSDWGRVAMTGSIVVLPFWIASLLGWSTGGLEEVWGGEIEHGTAYLLHGTQTVLFFVGLAVLYRGINSS